MPLNTHGVILRTVTDSAGTSVVLNLHDGDKYLMEYYFLGDPEVDESWIHPDAGGVGSYMGRRVPRPVKMVIMLHLLPYKASTTGGASTHAQLQANAQAVRDQFEARENYIEVGMSSATLMRFHTWPSPISPATFEDDRSLEYAVAVKRILDWRIEIWRDPTPVTAPTHMPVL